MHRIARLSLSLLAAACVGGPALAEDAATPRQALDRLLGQGLEHAHQRLAAKYVFQPFALVLHEDGAIEQLGGRTGDELDASTPDRLDVDPAKTLAELRQEAAKQVKAGGVAAVGLFSDAEIKLPDGRDSQAIEADLEHAAGGCTTVFEPYGFVDGQTLSYGAQIRTKRKGTIFPCP